jgi:hypothetical protein
LGLGSSRLGLGPSRLAPLVKADRNDGWEHDLKEQIMLPHA